MSSTRSHATRRRPGDLVFFPRADGFVHHVAAHVGDGRIIEARNDLRSTPPRFATVRTEDGLPRDNRQTPSGTGVIPQPALASRALGVVDNRDRPAVQAWLGHRSQAWRDQILNLAARDVRTTLKEFSRAILVQASLQLALRRQRPGCGRSAFEDPFEPDRDHAS